MKVQDIMTANVVCISDGATIKDAHLLMQSRGVRHLPVISEANGTLVGLLTHKKMVTTVIGLLNRYGTGALDRHERYTPLAELMETDFTPLTTDTALTDVVDYFISNKHGCLPVVDSERKVLGIVTSSDFVKLCSKLLKG
ncbi:CBS domain-containing protein [Shewanella dokdonensis]|uniref:CBS domain-containing protein n=1 Tax=Shewanella dokdonensis TaxID=712036 RepID=A0ABX8DD45_9GAMM|nr:CBS domain-containing protein [Shewanella dokdonensis]MCL1074672.1 CBS domain-containing protein [Shewanella dokdonensis]QVK22340.1 CBS domain-containing protein [Shewanella dokdonensis]